MYGYSVESVHEYSYEAKHQKGGDLAENHKSLLGHQSNLRSLVTEMFKINNKLSPPFICDLVKEFSIKYQTRSHYSITENEGKHNIDKKYVLTVPKVYKSNFRCKISEYKLQQLQCRYFPKSYFLSFETSKLDTFQIYRTFAEMAKVNFFAKGLYFSPLETKIS